MVEHLWSCKVSMVEHKLPVLRQIWQIIQPYQNGFQENLNYLYLGK